jgi:hypothetical protein
VKGYNDDDATTPILFLSTVYPYMLRGKEMRRATNSSSEELSLEIMVGRRSSYLLIKRNPAEGTGPSHS